MADTIQIVDFPYVGSRDRLIFDLADVEHYAYAQGSLKVNPGAKTQQFSQGDRRWDGARQTDEKLANGSLAWTVHVRGQSTDDVAARIETYLQQIDARARGRHLKWIAGGDLGVSRPVFSEVRGTATYTPDYDSLKLQSGWALDVQVTVPIAPLANWACCDIDDRFDQDTVALGDWEHLDGTGFVTDPAQRPGGMATVTGRKVLVHRGRGYTFSDWEVIVPFRWNGSTGGAEMRAYVKILDTILHGVRVNGTNLNLFWQAEPDDVPTDWGGTATAACALTAGRNYWMRVRQRGRVVTASVHTLDITLPPYGATAPDGGVLQTVTTTLTASEFLVTRPGEVGLAIAGGTLAAMPQLYGFQARPFSFPDVPAPRKVMTGDPIPGTAPARCDVSLMSGTGFQLPTWALLAQWAQRPRNLARDGAFPLGGSSASTGEWSAAAVASRHAAGTLGVGSTAGPYPEDGTLSFSTPGTAAQEGIHATLQTPLQQGRRYSVRVMLRAQDGGGTLNLNALLSRAQTGGPVTAGTDVAVPEGQWTEVLLDLRPDADYPDGAMLTIRTQGTAAVGVSVGAVVFTDRASSEIGRLSLRQRAGFGGLPLGWIRANSNVGTLQGWSRGSATGFAADGEVLRDTAPSAASQYRAEWWIDPVGLDPDEYSDQVTLAVWIRWFLHPGLVVPRATVWTEPETSVNATSIPGKRAYSTAGAIGKRLDLQPLGGVARALWKPHGTIVLPTDPDMGRVRLILAAQLAAGSTGTLFGLGALMLVPVDRTQATPSGVAGDSSYPRLTNVRPFEKRIASDGRGRLRQGINPFGPDTGMGGPAIELTPGAPAEVLVACAENVPDDPTPASTSDSFSLSTDVRLIVTPRSRLMRG